MYHFKMNPACGCGGYGGSCGCHSNPTFALENPSAGLILGAVAGLAAAGGAAWWFVGRKAGPAPVTAPADMPEADWKAAEDKAYRALVEEEAKKGWPAMERELIGDTMYRMTGGAAGKDKPPRYPWDVYTKMNDFSANNARIAAMGVEEAARRDGLSPEFAAGFKFLANHVTAVGLDGKSQVISREEANKLVTGGKSEYAFFNQLRPKGYASRKAAFDKMKGKK